MPLTIEQFAKAVVTSGLSSADEIKVVWGALPANQRPKDGATFAKVLIEQKKLTTFQAQELLAGGSTPLLLGDYVLLAKIGAGGMGQVFKAQHRHMKRLVAIKLLPSALTQDEAAVKRFQREVEAAAKLTHPNIVQAFDASVQRGVWYLVMEYAEGRDLAGVVAAEGPLPIPRAVEYIRQAARGLAFAHENGVVHRDIKPANLLLDKKGVLKILDMGLARIDNAAQAQEGLTQSGQVMGTVDYMAPEQAFDTKSADARADIYSLGCTLYRLLTGQNMYDGDTLVQKLMAHQSKPIPALAEARPDVPPALVAIFERMVAKSPDDRYQSLTDVDADLAALDSTAASGPSPNVTAPADGSLQSFFDSVGGLRTSSAAPAAARAKGKGAPTKGTAELEQTVNLSSPQHGTDPLSDRAIKAARDQSSRNAVPPRSRAKPQPPLWKRPPVLIAAGLGGFLLIALGVWAIVRDKHGNEIGKIKVPEGGSVEVKPDSANAAAAAKPSAAKPAAGETNFATQATVAKWLIENKKLAKIGFEVNGEVQYLDALPAGPTKVTVLNFHFANNGGNLLEEDIPRLAVFTDLEDLSLSRTPLTDAGLVRLAPLKKLKRLDIWCTQVTPAAVKTIREFPALEFLHGPEADAWLEPLAGMPSLRSLLFYRAELSPAAVSWFKQYPKLDSLEFAECGVWPNEKIALLKDCELLTKLTLSETPLDDAGLDLLSGCTKLTELNVTNTKVTEAGVKKLSAALPRCKITWSGGVVGPAETQTASPVPADKPGSPASAENSSGGLPTAVTVGYPGKFALVFPKPDEARVEVPTLSADVLRQRPLTWEVWVRWKPPREAHRLIMGFNDHLALVSDSGALGYRFAGSRQGAPFPPGDKPGEWTWEHVAFVADGDNKQRMFVNGREAAVVEKAEEELPPTGAPFLFAQRFAGMLGEARISSIARYAKDFTPRLTLKADKHSLALYRFDEGQGDVLRDASGNNHHGKIVGANWVKIDNPAPPAPKPNK